MPRFSRKSRRRIGGTYCELDLKFLSKGPHGVPCSMTSAEDAGDEDAIRAAWEALKATILPEWIRTRPGTRPWAWWRFDAPERRERIDGKLHSFDCKDRTLHVAKSDRKGFWQKAYALHWGMPASFIFPFDRDLYHDFMRNILHGRESAIFEP